MGAEDFAFMLQKKAGAYFFLGNGRGEHHQKALGPCQLHNPHYDFNDALIEKGAQIWVDLVSGYLKNA
jgi:metal-dependent amidase/aminoacylase/carboxypeptidase family protein